jgi:hypothetical protein
MTGDMGMHTNNHETRMHPNTVRSDLVQALADGPKSAAELPSTLHHRTLASERIDKLSVSGTGGGGGDIPNPLYYLYGDERQAAREFVRRHPEFVESRLSRQGPDELSTRLSEPLYRLITEEHQLHAHTNE